MSFGPSNCSAAHQSQTWIGPRWKIRNAARRCQMLRFDPIFLRGRAEIFRSDRLEKWLCMRLDLSATNCRGPAAMNHRDHTALTELTRLVYEELRRVGHHLME